ncbi:hypothetical protein G9A89_009646 [Geosiphon pyriformis]|nr:hypothetical protein G9A89_009646 [Geosiphon pyriformis]
MLNKYYSTKKRCRTNSDSEKSDSRSPIYHGTVQQTNNPSVKPSKKEEFQEFHNELGTLQHRKPFQWFDTQSSSHVHQIKLVNGQIVLGTSVAVSNFSNQKKDSEVHVHDIEEEMEDYEEVQDNKEFEDIYEIEQQEDRLELCNEYEEDIDIQEDEIEGLTNEIDGQNEVEVRKNDIHGQNEIEDQESDIEDDRDDKEIIPQEIEIESREKRIEGVGEASTFGDPLDDFEDDEFIEVVSQLPIPIETTKSAFRRGSGKAMAPIEFSSVLDRIKSMEKTSKKLRTSTRWAKWEKQRFEELYTQWPKDLEVIAQKMGTKTLRQIQNHIKKNYPDVELPYSSLGKLSARQAAMTNERVGCKGKNPAPRAMCERTSVANASKEGTSSEPDSSDDEASTNRGAINLPALEEDTDIMAIRQIGLKQRRAVPQVKLVNGRVVVDQESLRVDIWEDKNKVVSGRVQDLEVEAKARNVTRNTYCFELYGARLINRWHPKEVELFYELLKYFGPDFDLLNSCIRDKQEFQIRNKWKKECKVNFDRIQELANMYIPIKIGQLKVILAKYYGRDAINLKPLNKYVRRQGNGSLFVEPRRL